MKQSAAATLGLMTAGLPGRVLGAMKIFVSALSG
jgi:hypothetical protein